MAPGSLRALPFLSTLVSLFTVVKSATNVTVFNNCSTTIWPARYSASATITSDDLTGWEAAPQTSQTLEMASGWTGFFWARQECDSSGQCKTGSCLGAAGDSLTCGKTPNVPVTEIEFSFTEPYIAYDISLLEGFNLPVSVTPSNSSCGSQDCSYDFNPECPSSAQAVTSNNRTLACWRNSDGIESLYREHCPTAYYSPTDFQGGAVCPDTTATYTLTFCPNGDSAPTTSSTATPEPTESSITDDTSSEPRGGLSKGAIAGMVVGIIVGMAITVVATVLFMRRRRARKQNDLLNPPPSTVVPFTHGSDPDEGEEGIPPSWHVTPFTGGTEEKDKRTGEPRSPNTASLLSPGSTSALGNVNATGSSAATAEQHVPTGEVTPAEFQRLFEGRRFEGQLLSFLADRMDPPPEHPFDEYDRVRGDDDDDDADGSVAPPPTYHSGRPGRT